MLQNSGRAFEILRGIRALLFNCADITSTDVIYIISNASTSGLAEEMKLEALKVTSNVKHEVVPNAKMHGEEPGRNVAEDMAAATVVFCLTKMSMAHTKARLNANNNNVRFFSLPDYSENVVRSKALLADFKSIKKVSVKLAEVLSNGFVVKITTETGTDLTMNISGRKANPAPGFCYDDVLLASPPDAETNIAPNEYLTNGKAVIDGSIPCSEIGLIVSPLTLEIKNGFVTSIVGEKQAVLKSLFDKENDNNYRLVAEFGIGLNKLAVLKGSMLEDEGVLGTIHLGIGSNKTIGGINDVPFHLDHVIRNATVVVDERLIMKDGILSPEYANLLA